MPEENMQNSGKLLDENISQIFIQYQNRQKSLETSIRILLLFSILFFFIIQIPYISIRVRNDKISTELQGSMSILNYKKKLMDDYREAQAGIEDLHKQINESPKLLRQFLQQLNETQNNAMFVQQPLSQTNEPFDIRVRNEVIKHFEI
jgi:peptidoglycan hydrolase CwlO-like protein